MGRNRVTVDRQSWTHVEMLPVFLYVEVAAHTREPGD